MDNTALKKMRETLHGYFGDWDIREAVSDWLTDEGNIPGMDETPPLFRKHLSETAAICAEAVLNMAVWWGGY